MNRIDYTYLEARLREFINLARAAAHPDVKQAYLSYVRHYRTLLNTLEART